MKAVVALGGNAFLKRGEKEYIDIERRNIESAIDRLSEFIANNNVVITHGNGPQVGDELLRNLISNSYVPSLNIALMIAETQGYIGSIIVSSLARHSIKASCVITHVITSNEYQMKPIGPYLSDNDLNRLGIDLSSYSIKEFSKGYRILVRSPYPLKIVEIDAIKSLMSKGVTPIACGGGGVPLDDNLNYLNGVIDKDLSSYILAKEIDADSLFILTDIDYLYKDYPECKQPIKEIDSADATSMLDSLEEGSIRPKLEAAIRFVEATNKEAYIGDLYRFNDIIARRSGTRVYKKR
ncbi:MAG: carbamate kinase [Candidatus Micrarchaeota archaeon]|nr:MAG: carbamate kinase [Candidatus Micrarchaeota archaeon]